ncbi:MAG TPA: flagellar hook-associated protein FlgL [Kofleriaceae bacterium]|nr:flagellar hook-associated protein FlgL [Kofleriaceae bacterium]
MRITAHHMLELASQATAKAQSDVAEVAGQVTSGKRVVQPSDDPIAWAQARRAELRKAVSSGTGDALGYARDQLSQTDQALSTIGDTLAQAKELAVQAANSSLSAADRLAIGDEIGSLFEVARSAANTRNVSGEYLLAGGQGGAEPFDARGAYHGDAAARSVAIGESGSAPVTIPGTVLTAAAGVDVLPAIARFQTALANNDAAGIQTAIDELTTAHTQVSKARTNLGSMVGVLDEAKTAGGQLEDTLGDRIASLTEVDMVTAATELAQRNAALTAAQTVNSRLAQLLNPQ